MTQGMYSAVSGIRANQTRLNVISNNISNVNTLGFKSSMANFATVFAQTITGGTPPNGNLGGTNPRQVGNGVVVGEIASNWGQGGTQFTGRNTDLMIQGDGFFAVERIDANNGNASTDFYLSRAGNFSLDSNGNLVTSAGNRIRGTSQINGTAASTLGRVNIPLEFVIVKDIAADGSTVLGTHFGRNLSAAEIAGGLDYSNFGAAPFNNAAAGTASRTVTPVELRSFSIGQDGAITAVYSNGDRVTVRTDQSTVVAGNPDLSRREIVHLPYEGGSYGSNNLEASDRGLVSQMTGFEIFDGGGQGYSGAQAMEGMQLQVQTATVTNNAGLLYDGNNNFTIGANSGDTNFGVASIGARGSLLAGALESSNVDLAGEFTGMVITQRGLEAASRVIRAQSEVLQTIIQTV